jgi:hypothetical protein
MGVWDGVISQPRPNLLDTHPVTVHLQRRDELMTDFIARFDKF